MAKKTVGSSGSQGSASGNTKPKRASACICWSFTVFNYDENTLALLAPELDRLCTYWVFGHEICPDTKLKHLQGYLEFKKKMRPLESQVFKDFKIHFESSKANREKNTMYCIKDGNWSTNLHDYINTLLAVKIKAERYKFNQHITLDELYDWQKNFVKKFVDLCPKFNRTITWLWEPTGSIGKSIMAKYMVDQMDALQVAGKAGDIKHGVITYHEKKGWFPPIVVIDVPRVNNGAISYQAIEEVKNGLIFSPKYESCQARFNTPWIIVFANEAPDRSNFSADRWEILMPDSQILQGISPGRTGPPYPTGGEFVVSYDEQEASSDADFY